MSNIKNIAILNYGLGNIRSISNALHASGANALLTDTRDSILESDGLIIPGVGAFPNAMNNLEKKNLIQTIKDFSASQKPILGICLGMQLLFDKGYEHEEVDGLGLISGDVKKIDLSHLESARLPHIRWATVSSTSLGEQDMFNHIPASERRFYFIHSYAATNVSSSSITSFAGYHDLNFVASVQSGNIWGVQFHPEKSGISGLQLISNFISKC